MEILYVLDGSDYILPHKAKITHVIVHKAILDNNYYNGNIRGLSGRVIFQEFFFMVSIPIKQYYTIAWHKIWRCIMPLLTL